MIYFKLEINVNHTNTVEGRVIELVEFLDV